MIKEVFFASVFFVLLLSSCANSNIYLQEGESSWKDRLPPSKQIKHSVYLIGDVGGAKEGQSTLPLLELEKHLKMDSRLDSSTDVVFLGDNIYPVGMPPIGHKDRKDAEGRLDLQLESVRAFKGNVTFVPGNHDWYKFGRDGLKRQEEYIESYLSQYNETFTDFFRPSNGCGDIEVLRIAENLALVSVDSHWFLTQKEKEYDYSDCKLQTRRQMIKAFSDTLAQLNEVDVLLTMHHPFYTTGKHGGYFSASSYLAPSTALNKGLIIPTPVIGLVLNTIIPKLSAQDTRSQPYVDYRNNLIPPIKEHGNTIVAAGHEHTLQYHHVDGVDYIVSGSGSKTDKVAFDSNTKFAYGNHGYALLDYYYSGEVWIAFHALSENEDDFIEVYRKQLR